MVAPLIIAFKNTLEDLFEFIKKECPEETQTINTLQMYTRALEQTGLMIFFTWSYGLIEKFGDDIMNCNEHFFLNELYDTNWTVKDKEYFEKFTHVFKCDLSDEKRVKTWWHFQQLVKIGRKVKSKL